jgi:probable HAF family extracellular repeat protein
MEAISFSNGDLVGLGGLPGYSGSLANAINSHGTVAGAVFFPGNAVLGSSIAVTFDSQGIHNLGALPCFGPNDQLVATAINANGDVVGWGNSNGTVEAMLFRGGRIIDLGAGYAVGINDSGEIVGYTSSAHAAIFSTSGPPNIIESLGTSSDANAVNNKGQIVGGFQTGAVVGNTSIQHAFIYNNGQMKDLGVPAGGISSSALAINDQGVVVGQWWDSSGQTHAFIDSNGVMVDLQTLIPSGSGWTLDGAAGINNNGDIVGNGTTNGAVRGYLLEPTHSGG